MNQVLAEEENQADSYSRSTLADVAKIAGVSAATVSAVLAGKALKRRISEDTLAKVMQAADVIGYRPNQAARSLATGRTGFISLWLWSEPTQNSYHSAVSRLMHTECQNVAYQLLINPFNYATLDATWWKKFDAWHADGIIAHEASHAILDQLEGKARPPIPVVATGTYQLYPNVDQVFVDISQGARQAMEHLLLQGRKNIVYVSSATVRSSSDPRFKTYESFMEDSGFPKRYLEVPENRAGVRERIRTFVTDCGVPDALFCHNDDMAIAAYRGLCDLGVKVPDDVAIVGCDGIEDGEYLEVPITTIAQPLHELCRLATQFLDARIDDPTRPLQEARLIAPLVIRQSTGGEI